MQTAPIQAVVLPQNLLTVWVQVAQRLAELGLKIAPTAMAGKWVGYLDEADRTVYIRADAAPEDQLWLLRQVEDLLTLGLHACPAARVEPLLQLVPPESSSSDQTA